MTVTLVVLNGPSPGTTCRLDPESDAIDIGRSPPCDLRLDDHRASRLHARISFRANRWHLEDCQSLNGTHVNSQPIEQAVLEPGDLIRIGERLILFADSADEPGPSPLNPSSLRATTLYGRATDAPASLLERSCTESMSRVVRDSAVLCRLANQLHQRDQGQALLRAAIDALVDGLDPEAVSVWLVGTDGRLRCAARWGPAHDEHVLASLAVERNKAMLMGQLDGNPEHTVSEEREEVATALAVPIPGRQTCRGAIECHRLPEGAAFSPSDLDFTVVVAHQTGAALENLEHRERLQQANVELRRRLEQGTELIGSSQVMQKVLDQVARVGPTNSNVLVLGESGTGKELVARSIHETSQRSDGPYLAVNCAAFSESLLESELFGHEVGAFTGADRQHIGQFERAHRGTLFLDEVGEMSPACQAKLLRILEGHAFQRLGGHQLIHVDVRLIAATHCHLEELVRQGKFREDLYYRLRVIDIAIPPLRERGDDVIELASRFLEHYRNQMGRGGQRLSREAAEALRRYPWPGNVRELKNAVERAVVLGSHEELMPADLGLPDETPIAPPDPQLMSLREAERRHILHVLEQVKGNKTQACKILEIGRGTLYNKLGPALDRQDPPK